jgi:hypothetical protein
METIERQELINYVKEELMCTIVSADAPTTIPVLITTFRFFKIIPKIHVIYNSRIKIKFAG